MGRNKIIFLAVFLLFISISLMAKPIGFYLLTDTTLTNGDTLSLTVSIDNDNIQSGLWIHDIDPVVDSLKMYFYVSDYKDSVFLLVDSCMNTGFKYIDLSKYYPRYLYIKAFVADSAATLKPKLILTHTVTIY